MDPLLIFLDLDRTLYRTTAAGVAKWQKIGELYPNVDTQTAQDEQRRYYLHDGDNYAYDFTAHISSLGLDAVMVYEQLRQSELADGRLEYDSARELITWAQSMGRVKVLTYGTDDYQRLKASLCPSLHDIEVITTLGSKSDYLKHQGEAWLVDDKPLGDILPANIRFIQAHLEGQSIAAVTWPVVTSLRQVPQLIQR
jgi:FMN phosphatase YigB (HAD superfamily)